MKNVICCFFSPSYHKIIPFDQCITSNITFYCLLLLITVSLKYIFYVFYINEPRRPLSTWFINVEK